jgi:hypothetical protein
VLERQLELRVSFFSVAMAGSDCSANPATLTAEQEARGEEEEEEEEEEMALQSESEDYFDFMGCDRSVRNSASTISRSSSRNHGDSRS